MCLMSKAAKPSVIPSRANALFAVQSVVEKQSIIEKLPDLFDKPLHGVQLLRDGFAQKNSGCQLFLQLRVGRNRKQRTTKPLWSLKDEGDRYSSLVELFCADQVDTLTIDCEGKGSFEYTDQSVAICWEENGTGPEHYFQSLGLGLWLEKQGVPCIHANALAIDDFAIGILAPSQTGKTTLTAALLHAGLAMMSDDMLALYQADNEWRVYPSWPIFRVWPDSAKMYAETDIETLPRVHSRFDKRIIDLETCSGLKSCQSSRPLKQLYLLDRQSTTESSQRNSVTIEAVSPAHALVHLLQNSMLGGAYSALGVEQGRLKKLAALLEMVPLKKITYNSGMELLPEVCKTLLADAKA